MQVNFQGIYDTVKRVARAAFPQGQQGNVDLVDTVAEQKLGMPVPEAIGLLSGEFASMQTSPSMDSAKQVYFFGIRKKPETLKLMRTVFSDQITSERNEGEVTFVKISLGGKQGAAGVAQWNFFNLAVTQYMVPDWLEQMNLQVVARHLHYSSSVSWKDSKGIHWDQWVE